MKNRTQTSSWILLVRNKNPSVDKATDKVKTNYLLIDDSCLAAQLADGSFV